MAITSWHPAFKVRESLQSCDSSCCSLQHKLFFTQGGTLVVEVLREQEVSRKVLILLTGKVSLHKESHSFTNFSTFEGLQQSNWSKFTIQLSTFIIRIVSPEPQGVLGIPMLSAEKDKKIQYVSLSVWIID